MVLFCIPYLAQNNGRQPLIPNPPSFKGRPSLKKRKKDVNETDNNNVVKRKKRSNACSNCGMLGHNIKKCKNPAVARGTNNNRPNQDQHMMKLVLQAFKHRQVKLLNNVLKLHQQRISLRMSSIRNWVLMY